MVSLQDIVTTLLYTPAVSCLQSGLVSRYQQDGFKLPSASDYVKHNNLTEVVAVLAITCPSMREARGRTTLTELEPLTVVTVVFRKSFKSESPCGLYGHNVEVNVPKF
ncbi:MAG: hypothetical protein MHM6MM_006994 [Cercozoa sp. M6MM]